MKKLKYVFKRIFNMNFSGFLDTIKRVSKKSGKNKIYLFFDIIYCGFKYMAGYVDYEVFEFYNLTSIQRKTFITRGINNKICVMFNHGKSFSPEIDDKILFHERYDKYLNRKWLDLRKRSEEEFIKFVKDYKNVIAKPVDESCGKGVIKINDKDDLKKIYKSLLDNKQILVEEYIIQHKDISSIYPNSVNTLRIVTICKNNKVHVMFRSIRIGNAGNVVDNFNHGGMYTTIDEDGIIRKPAIDKKGNIYEEHPSTMTKIVGTKIPYFDEVIKYVEKLALVTPDVGYIGWDIAVTDKGPTVIEGNAFPGHDIYQSKIHLNENGFGMLPDFEKVLGKIV